MLAVSSRKCLIVVLVVVIVRNEMTHSVSNNVFFGLYCVRRLPPILGYSVEDELVPKWEYLRKVCTQATFELSTFPAYFSYPLDRVIKTRYEYLLMEKRIPTQFVALDVVLRYGDRDFATQVARDTDGGAALLQFAERRKNSQGVRRKRAPRTKKSTWGS